MSCGKNKERNFMRNLTIQKKILLWFSTIILIVILLISALNVSSSDLVIRQGIKDRLSNFVSLNIDQITFIPKGQSLSRTMGMQYVDLEDGTLAIDDDFYDNPDGIQVSLYDSEKNLLYGSCPVKTDSKDFSFTSVGTIGTGQNKYYIYELPLNFGDNSSSFWLRGVVPYSDGTVYMKQIVNLGTWLLPSIAALAILGGYIITRRCFLPVEQIAKEADKISQSGDLTMRLNLGLGDDEMHRLANTFNSMFDRLEKSFIAEKQFTSDASHELRTPTSVILAQAQYGLELADCEEEYRESLEVILRQGQRMSDIISQLLFFTRLDQGSEKARMEETDVSQLVSSICQDQSIIKTKGITIVDNVQPGIVSSIDINLFSRMLSNLISNAYKYGKENGTIWVSLSRESNLSKGHVLQNPNANPACMVLSVKDDGIGISRENLSKIWDRFFQAESSRNSEESGGGIGLGLSMVKQISKLLGGSIDVSSQPGIGTTFTFIKELTEK